MINGKKFAADDFLFDGNIEGNCLLPSVIARAGDDIILHKCTKNHNHMMYASWHMECNRQNFSSFWAIFCFFPLLTTWKIKISKKWRKKTPGDIIILHLCTTNDDHDVWFPRYGVWQTEFFVILGHFLPYHTTNNLKTQNFEKIKKSTWRYYFILVYHK